MAANVGRERNQVIGESEMTAEVKNGQLVITLPLRKEPKPSASGKTLVVASTSGNQPTAVQINGETLIVGVNAYIAA
jgi:hypothetical protein